VHLQRALYALRVARLDSRGARRIDARELCVQRRPTEARGALFDLRAQPRLGSRQIRESVRKRTEVEHGAAGEDRDAAARVDLLAEAKRVVAKAPGRIR